MSPEIEFETLEKTRKKSREKVFKLKKDDIKKIFIKKRKKKR